MYFPIEFEIKTLRNFLEVNIYLTTTQKHCLDQLNELDEMHLDSIHHTDLVQQQHQVA
jgi:hypothetical protein